MTILLILVLSVTCTILSIDCEELTADFDMSIDTSQSVYLGFEVKDKVLEPECEKQKPPAWCPVVDRRDVKFSELPEKKKTFTFKGDRTFKIAVKKQIPQTQLSTVKFGCDIGHNVEQNVNAGFEITNGAQMCPKGIDLNNFITCKVDEADKKKVSFEGACKAKQDFTFTGKDGGDKKIDLKVDFTTVDSEKPIETTASTTVTTATSTKVAAVKTSTLGAADIEKETTTTSIGNKCKFPTIILATLSIFGFNL